METRRNEENLRGQTAQYWHALRANRDSDTVIRHYIGGPEHSGEPYSGLLKREIDCSKRREEARRRESESPIDHNAIWPTEKADTLVLLVGYSPDPLLLAACAYEPKAILLVLNPKYREADTGRVIDGETFRDERVEPYINLLHKAGLIAEQLEILPKGKQPPLPSDDSPGAVFQFLLTHLPPGSITGRRVVVDISGGKKNMVAGAFLFAAYTDARISYVDFDEYSEKDRRPYGYSCRIGTLLNPYETFALKDWEHVRQLYDHYAFDAAAELLKSIACGMRREYFSKAQIRAACLLRRAMLSYHAWSNGDYTSAMLWSHRLERLTQRKFKTLSAVDALGESWPNLRRNKASSAPGFDLAGFYADSGRLLTYALDESLKVRKFVERKADYRSGLFRAFGLCELILKACIAIAVQDDVRLLEVNKNSDKARQWIARHLGANQALTLLNLPAGAEESFDDVRFKKQKETPRSPWRDRLDELRDRRNKVTHQVTAIPQEVADEAVQVMHDVLTSFEEQWIALIPAMQRTALDVREPPSWRDLCDWCSIDFLPAFE